MDPSDNDSVLILLIQTITWTNDDSVLYVKYYTYEDPLCHRHNTGKVGNFFYFKVLCTWF